MINIQPLILDKYKNEEKYVLIEGNIYRDLTDPGILNHRAAMTMQLEETEDSQYPLDDILTKYSLYVSDFVDDDTSLRILNIELAGALEDLRIAISSITGKRVFNQDFVGEDGRARVRLVIE